MTTPFNLASFADKVSSTGTANPSAISDIANTSTGALALPVGTTAQRNGTPVNGMTRINSTTSVLEVYYNGAWVTISTFTPPGPTVIGQAWGGGYYAGQISTTGNGVATHYLIVAPKETGESPDYKWDNQTTVTTGINSAINGPSNTTSLAALGARYQAATWCEGLTIGGYTDWYLPAKNELEVLYYFLKPNANLNNVGQGGANNNAVSPEPINTAYTANNPARTSSVIFRTGGAQAFEPVNYFSSTEALNFYAWVQEFDTGSQAWGPKGAAYYTRAVRRIAI